MGSWGVVGVALAQLIGRQRFVVSSIDTAEAYATTTATTVVVASTSPIVTGPHLIVDEWQLRWK